MMMLEKETGQQGLLRGILFGDIQEIEEDTYDTFRRNGTAHVLAVSGLHIGLSWLQDGGCSCCPHFRHEK